MDAELKAKWVKALRSGEYKQGHGRLKTAEGGYCCLGVLCAVAGWSIDKKGNNLVGHSEGYAKIWSVTRSEQECRNLATMNDNLAPFPEIADYIEKRL